MTGLPADPLDPPDQPADLLDQLADLLERQLELARDGQYEAMSELSQQAADLMGRLARAAEMMSAPARAAGNSLSADAQALQGQLTRLRNLHRRLALTLADQQQELAQRLAHSRRGGEALRGYGGAG